LTFLELSREKVTRPSTRKEDSRSLSTTIERLDICFTDIYKDTTTQPLGCAGHNCKISAATLNYNIYISITLATGAGFLSYVG